jgi:uncharacterized protein (DUF1800 family)
MLPTRFAFLKATGFVASAAAIVLSAGVIDIDAQKGAVPARADAQTIAHVLDRITFGARPGDIGRIEQTGLAAYIEQQLHPERIADGAMVARLSEFETIRMSAGDLASEIFVPADQLRRQMEMERAKQAAADPAMMAATNGNAAPPPPGTPPQPQQPPSPEQRMLQQRQQNVVAELMQAKVLRAALSERQLEEVLVDFWFNHFNVFVNKGQVRQYITEYEREAIRPYVLDDFRKMLGATAHHPAMLFYLDNFQSRAPASAMGLAPDVKQRLNNPRLTPQQRQQMVERLAQARPQRPQGGLNENYARELMELHTLGVDAGYTQQDVIEVARILTGWTIDRPQQGGSFVFRPQMHDGGKKVVMGQTFNPGGEGEGEKLLDMLASHPATARHIAFKLAQRFVADEPPAALVDRVAKRYMDTKGNLREVTRAVLTSPEFFDTKYFDVKTKTPLEFVISALRATNANVTNAQPIVVALRDMGMPLYGAQPPTGYSMTADAWVNTGALLARLNFGVQLLNGGVPQRAPGQGRGGDVPQRPIQGQGQGGAQAQQQMQQFQRQLAQTGRGPIQVDVRSIAPDTSGESVDRVIDLLLGGRASDATRQTIARAETPQQLIALTLGSPEFQKR